MIEANQAGRAEHWRIAHLAFHTSLANATQNIILMKVWGLIALFLKDSPLVTGQHSPIDTEVHQSIVDAIARHAPEAAVAAMNRHITDMMTAVG